VSRALVIGAQGVLGTLIARELEATGWQVLRGGRHPEDSADFRLVDLDQPATLPRALEDVDLVISTTPDVRLTAERHILEQGGTLINVSALPVAAAADVMGLASSSKGLVVMNAGFAPGVTNLVAATMLDEHREADAIEICLNLSASGCNGRAGRAWTFGHLTARHRHSTAVIPLPPPLGSRTCMEFAESERGWIGAVAEDRDVRCCVCFAQRPVHTALLTLNRVGLISRLPKGAFLAGARSAPARPSSEPISEWIALLLDGQRIAARTVQAGGDYQTTAAVACILAARLLDPSVPAPREAGCFSLEQLFTLDELQADLASTGIQIVGQEMR
jgi:hypothetical protein